MDRSTGIGLVLIFILFFVWAQFNNSSSDELTEQQKLEQDSIAKINTQEPAAGQTPDSVISNDTTLVSDSLRQILVNKDLELKFGIFANSASGTEKLDTLENEVFIVVLSNKGGTVKEVELKEYQQIIQEKKNEEMKIPLKFMNDPKNSFSYKLPLLGTQAAAVSSENLYYSVEKTAQSIKFIATASTGGRFIQTYSIEPGSYNIAYTVSIENLQSAWNDDVKEIDLKWDNYLQKLEYNEAFEKTYSTVYYRAVDESPDYCSCRSDDEAIVDEQDVKWFSHANQFFNSSLIAKSAFGHGKFTTRMLSDSSENLKLVTTEVKIPLSPANPSFAMDMYLGPNEFKRLRAYGVYLEDIIPYGSSIFGSINRWIIRPIFDFLSSFIGSAGIVILLLTLLVKLALSPLTYKMLLSQSKMSSLKPEMAGLKEKYKDDPQQLQVETMKIYREFGVNPLGGCLPMVAQMPIWFALYRFFPAAIEFRQEGFLWATDLSSYDVITYLPFEIPFYGAHVSLFTLLWAGTTIAYTYYNSKMMDMSAMNPAMMYMQYLMPIMFLFFFNSFAAGLACYLFFSNVLNIGQILITKNYLIDHDKIRQKLDENKKKPKKKSGFGARLEQVMKDQQRIQAEKKAKK